MKELTKNIIQASEAVTCKCVMNGWEMEKPTRLRKDVLKIAAEIWPCSAFRSEAFDSAFRWIDFQFSAAR
jgi:hypothetical protein